MLQDSSSRSRLLEVSFAVVCFRNLRPPASTGTPGCSSSTNSGSGPSRTTDSNTGNNNHALPAPSNILLSLVAYGIVAFATFFA
jgi:hypothetical protein